MVVTVNLLDAALDYAGRGWPVFPLEPGGKRPFGKLAPHGLKDASADSAVVRRWWQAAPTANVGLPTGLAFDALDVDSPAALAALSAAMPHADDPADDPYILGPTVKTPRGWHVYVAATGHGNSVNIGGLPGIDWRGQGGYVVGPGSIKPDGSGWSWYAPDDPLCGPESDLRPAPAWLVALLDRRTVAQPATPARTLPGGAPSDRYGQAALEREIGRLLLTQPGGRNDALNRAAHSLGQLVAAGKLDQRAVAAALLEAAQRLGLSEQEAVATILSGMRAGMSTPRRIAS